jgi:3-oxoacyl-[acyl-carrier-protein] synthase I
MNNRVVITGMGIYSCIGTSLEEVKESLYQGKSGIGIDPERKEFGFQSALTGIVPKPDLKSLLPRRQRMSVGQETEFAYMATIEALKNANISEDFFDTNEVGILYGNDSVSVSIIEATDIIREKKDTALIGSGAIFKSMNSTVTMNLSTIFRLRGINLTVSAACASGSHSIGLGYHLIKSGLQDIIICGGAQEINKYAMSSFDGLGVFSPREEEPTKASRPFDSGRDGLIPSGGGATLILESYESAVKRGAPIIAEVLGYGFSSNGGHISTPNVEGPSTAMTRALQDAKVNPSDIEYINAHATSTPVGDGNEAKAIFEVFGEKNPHVSSTKSMTGHECWMAGDLFYPDDAK